MKTNIVYVRFSEGKEYPYLNDKFDLAIGDKVYVDGKLAGQLGEVTEILTKFKVSLKYYKYVLQKVDMDIKGEFTKNENFFISTKKEAIPFEKLFSWLQGPKAIDKENEEESEKFICGEGYELELDKFDDIEDSEDPFIDMGTYWDAQEMSEGGEVEFVTVINGKGSAAVWTKHGFNIVEFDFDAKKMLMTNIFCTCISPRICDDMVAVAYTLNETIKRLSIPRDVDITIIEQGLFNKVTDGKTKTVIL